LTVNTVHPQNKHDRHSTHKIPVTMHMKSFHRASYFQCQKLF